MLRLLAGPVTAAGRSGAIALEDGRDGMSFGSVSDFGTLPAFEVGMGLQSNRLASGIHSNQGTVLKTD